jgi:hypothetical protein
MNTIDNGGAAFPIPNTYHSNGQIQYGQDGMTLRDYFAAAALTGLMNRDSNQRSLAEQDVEYCFAIADAMVAFGKKS